MAVITFAKQHLWKPFALIIFFWLQYQLWFDETSVVSNWSLSEKIESQREINDALRARNQVLVEEILAIKAGNEAIEAKARKELGMVKQGETFFIVVDPIEQAKP